MKIINSFIGEYRFLSNFYPIPVEYNGIIYPTSEHAYQASKTKFTEVKIIISKLSTPKEAKRYGRKVKMDSDFEELKVDIMKLIVYKKFKQNKWLMDKLLLTGNAILIEGNYWNDTFWGVCNNKGQNNLGLILMGIRQVEKFHRRFKVKVKK